jgi:hypothetical protein
MTSQVLVRHLKAMNRIDDQRESQTEYSVSSL